MIIFKLSFNAEFGENGNITKMKYDFSYFFIYFILKKISSNKAVRREHQALKSWSYGQIITKF